MGPRIYPSYQDTNLTSKGSLILSINSVINYIDIYVNSILVNREYSTVNGLYSVNLNLNDVVTILAPENFQINNTRRDYTTDDNNGNSGIVDTFITGTTTVGTYTFTATTISSSYNFEYRISIENIVPTPTPTPTLLPQVNLNLKIDTVLDSINGGIATFNQRDTVLQIITNGVVSGYYSPTIPSNIIFTGNTTNTYNLGLLTINPSDLSNSTSINFNICYTGLTSGSFVDNNTYTMNIYVGGILVVTQTAGPLNVNNPFDCSIPAITRFITLAYNNVVGSDILVEFINSVRVAGPITARYAPTSSGSTYTCNSAPSGTFYANGTSLSTITYLKSSIITTFPSSSYFYISTGGLIKRFLRIGSTDEAIIQNDGSVCTTPTPTPTPTSTPTPTATPT